jgi:hypothetical protein
MTLQQPQPQQQQRSISHEIEYGLDYIINLFDPTILYFPRTIMTKKLGYQKIVYSKEETLQYFKQSDYIDCRINSFRYYSNPNLIFIDIDRKDFKDDKSFDNALSTTLKNIKEKLNGYPAVLWSGNGYHIIQPVEGIDFENRFNETLSFINKEFSKDFDLFKEFLRFSKNFLSDGKSDPCFNPSPESCLLRIPGSLNGKFLENRNKRLTGNFEVKIIKKWNGIRPTVSDNYLECFADYLIQKKIKENNDRRNDSSNNNTNNNKKYYNNNSNYIPWIEHLLQSPIEDYRKLVIDLILAPYLINVRKLSFEESYHIIKEWLDKCNELKRLDNYRNFEYRISYALKTANKKLIPPMSYNTLKNNYQYLYSIIKYKVQN